MAYETGTAADVEVLAAKIAAFAQLQGWVLDHHYDNGAGSNMFYLHSGPHYILVIGQQDGQWIHGYGGTGFDPAANSGNGGLVNRSGYDGCNYCTAPIVEYHMFATNQYVHIAFLKGNGTWGNFVFGALTKTCNFTGGTYISGTALAGNLAYRTSENSGYNGRLFDTLSGGYTHSGAYTQVSAVRDTVHHWFHATSNDADDLRLACGYASGGISNESDLGGVNVRYSVQSALAQRNVNTFNGLAILHPMLVGVHWAANYFSWVGHPQDIKFLSIKYLNAKDIITIGADRWMVFPATSKQFVQDTAYSEYLGYAYLLPPL